MSTPLLEARDIRTWFPVRGGGIFRRTRGMLKAVDGVSLSVGRQEVLGLVGESGCGKSTLARTLIRLVDPVSGSVHFEGRDITRLSSRELRPLRTRLQMVFQDPYASLNPRMTVFDALAEPLRVHGLASRGEVAARVGALMEQAGLARRQMRKYPHEFSGGQRQRVAIARALATEPDIIIADEPVSALDVSVQAQILNLLMHLSRDRRLSMLFISHDLSVVRHVSDRIGVMYLGHLVEIGPADEVFDRPQHPYTRALLAAIPTPGQAAPPPLKGEPPSPLNPPSGCPFHPRCPFAIEACTQARPPLEPLDNPAHVAACIRQGEIARM